jgi:hypothetical protein
VPSHSYATLLVFANFLLDKASYLSSFSALDDSDDDDDDSASIRQEKQAPFPSFEAYLRQRPEVAKILRRRTLE